ILEEAGVPRGVVNLVTGFGLSTGVPLVTHEGVRVVSFTGSVEVGREVAKNTAGSFKHTSLEMGGKNVIMVMHVSNVDLAVDGAKLLCGGQRLAGGEYDCGGFYMPTIFGDCDAKMRVCQEEIFGPVISLIPADDLDQAIEIGNGVIYGLSSAIYTQDINKEFR